MANMITGIRLGCALILIICPIFSLAFYIFYIICGISDVFDGIVARKLGKETSFGAKFDTIADIAFILTVLIKIVCKVYIPKWLIICIICIAVIKCINIITGFVIYNQFIVKHTLMNKICGILMFAIPLYIHLLPYDFQVVLIILTCIVATFAAIQEGYYICNGKEKRR